MLAKIETALPINPVQTIADKAEIWFALLVRSMKEMDAADWLRRNCVPAYWPNYPWLVPVPGKVNGTRRRRVRLTSVIPGYLFIANQHDQDLWQLVQETPGVTGQIRDCQGDWAVLRRSQINVIREIEAKLNLPPPIKGAHNFKIGQRVRFKDDVHSAFPPGKIGKLLHDGRIMVDTYALGRVVPFTVFPHQIEAM